MKGAKELVRCLKQRISRVLNPWVDTAMMIKQQYKPVLNDRIELNSQMQSLLRQEESVLFLWSTQGQLQFPRSSAIDYPSASGGQY